MTSLVEYPLFVNSIIDASLEFIILKLATLLNLIVIPLFKLSSLVTLKIEETHPENLDKFIFFVIGK